MKIALYEKSVCMSICFFLFLSITDNFCSTNNGFMTSDSIIKVMLLINDANKVLPQGDPYAIMQIMGKLTTEIKYINFSQVTDVQLKQITNLIIKNIGLKQKQTPKAFLPFVVAFTKKIGVSLNFFLKNKEPQKVIVSFANQMLKMLPGLMAINPGLIAQLISTFQGVVTQFA